MEMPGIKTQSAEQKWKKQRGFKFQISNPYVLGPKVQPRVLHSLGPLLWLTQLQCQRRWSQWTLRRGSEGWQWAWWDGEAGELRGSCSWRSSHRPPPSGLLQAPPIAWRCTAVECLIFLIGIFHLFLDVRLLASGILHIGQTLRAGLLLHSSQIMWPSRHWQWKDVNSWRSFCMGDMSDLGRWICKWKVTPPGKFSWVAKLTQDTQDTPKDSCWKLIEDAWSLHIASMIFTLPT